MPAFMDVVNNWGDFGRRVVNPLKANFGGAREGIGVGERLGSWDGSAQGVGEPGYRAARMPANVARRLYEADLIQATGLIRAAFNGSDIARFHLKRAMQGGVREAMSISDFPHLFGDVIDRAVLANYLETPYTWNQVAYASEVNDFRPVKRFRVDGGTGLLSTLQSSIDPNPNQLTPLTMGASYPEDSLSDAQYTYQLIKQGKRMPFFWETFVNDDLNAIKDTPARFGRGARRTEEYFVTQLYAGNLTFFSNTNKNLVNAANAGGAFTTNDPALSITALQQAIVVMMNQLDTTGQTDQRRGNDSRRSAGFEGGRDEHPFRGLRLDGGPRRYDQHLRDEHGSLRRAAVARAQLGAEHREACGELLPADRRHDAGLDRLVSVRGPGKRTSGSGVWTASRSHDARTVYETAELGRDRRRDHGTRTGGVSGDAELEPDGRRL